MTDVSSTYLVVVGGDVNAQAFHIMNECLRGSASVSKLGCPGLLLSHNTLYLETNRMLIPVCRVRITDMAAPDVSIKQNADLEIRNAWWSDRFFGEPEDEMQNRLRDMQRKHVETAFELFRTGFEAGGIFAKVNGLDSADVELKGIQLSSIAGTSFYVQQADFVIGDVPFSLRPEFSPGSTLNAIVTQQ